MGKYRRHSIHIVIEFDSVDWETQLNFAEKKQQKTTSNSKNDKLVVKLNIQIGVLIKTNKHKHTATEQSHQSRGKDQNLFLNTIILFFGGVQFSKYCSYA